MRAWVLQKTLARLLQYFLLCFIVTLALSVPS